MSFPHIVQVMLDKSAFEVNGSPRYCLLTLQEFCKLKDHCYEKKLPTEIGNNSIKVLVDKDTIGDFEIFLRLNNFFTRDMPKRSGWFW